MFRFLAFLVLLPIHITTSTLSLNVYTKASETYSKLCPTSNQLSPKCGELKTKVNLARDDLLAQALLEGEEETTTLNPELRNGQEEGGERGEGQHPQPGEIDLIQSALEILSLSKRTCQSCNTCPDLLEPVNKIIGMVEELGENQDCASPYHLTIVFSFVAAALFILIITQLYNCISSCVSEKRSDRHRNTAREARILYRHLADIHIQHRAPQEGRRDH